MEKLRLEGGTEWEPLNITMPRALSSVGVFQLNLKELVVFGGWDNANQKDCYFIKEEAPNKFTVF